MPKKKQQNMMPSDDSQQQKQENKQYFTPFYDDLKQNQAEYSPDLETQLRNQKLKKDNKSNKKQQNGQQQKKIRKKQNGESKSTCKNINYMINYYPKQFNKGVQLILIEIQQIYQKDRNGNYLEQFVIKSTKYPQIRQVIIDKDHLPIFYQTILKTFHKSGQLQKKYYPSHHYDPSVKLIILYLFKQLFQYFKKYIDNFCKKENVWNNKKMGCLASLAYFFAEQRQKKLKNEPKYKHQTIHIGGMFNLCCRFFRLLIIVLLGHKEQLIKSQNCRNLQNNTKKISENKKFQDNLKKFAIQRIQLFRKRQRQQLDQAHRQIQGPLYVKVINRFIKYCEIGQWQKFDPKLSSIHHQIQNIRLKLADGSKIRSSIINRSNFFNREKRIQIVQIYMKGMFKRFKTQFQQDNKLTYNKQQKKILKQIQKHLKQQKMNSIISSIQIVSDKKDKNKLNLEINFNDIKHSKMNIYMTGRFILRMRTKQSSDKNILQNLIQAFREKFIQKQQNETQIKLSEYVDETKTITRLMMQCHFDHELDFNKLIQIDGIRQRLSWLQGKQYLTYVHLTKAKQYKVVYIYNIGRNHSHGYIKIHDLRDQQEAKQIYQYISSLYSKHHDMIQQNPQNPNQINQMLEQLQHEPKLQFDKYLQTQTKQQIKKQRRKTEESIIQNTKINKQENRKLQQSQFQLQQQEFYQFELDEDS